MAKTKEDIPDQKLHQDIIKVLSRITRVDPSLINNDVLIQDELGIDSLMGIEIIAKVEKHYDIHIEETLLLNINRVGDFIDFVKLKLLEKLSNG